MATNLYFKNLWAVQTKPACRPLGSQETKYDLCFKIWFVSKSSENQILSRPNTKDWIFYSGTSHASVVRHGINSGTRQKILMITVKNNNS